MVSIKKMVQLWAALPFMVFFSLIPQADTKIIAGGPQGGRYHQVSQQLEKSMKGDSQLSLKTRKTGGSITNIRGVNTGEFSFAIAQSNLVEEAVKGTGSFAKSGPMKNIQRVKSLHKEYVFLVVPKDSPIKSVKDLRGRHVGLGAAGSGTLATSIEILNAFGLNELDVKGHYMDSQFTLKSLKSGGIEAFFHIATAPSSLLSQLSKSFPISFIPITGSQAETLLQKKGFFRVTAPPLQGAPSQVVKTLGMNAILIARNTIGPDMLEKMTLALQS